MMKNTVERTPFLGFERANGKWCVTRYVPPEEEPRNPILEWVDEMWRAIARADGKPMPEQDLN